MKTNKGENVPPEFIGGNDAPPGMWIREHAVRPRVRAIGNPVDASDLGSTSLAYRLEGPDKALFNIDSRTGQIRTRSALDTEAICDPTDSGETGGHQETCTYKVRVRVRRRCRRQRLLERGDDHRQ